MTDIQMRLDELLRREITVRWYEGVAVVQSVARQLGTGRNDVFPAASEILLSMDGSVLVSPTTTGGAVRTAAKLLGAMLSDDVPVRLRLIVAQATGSESAYPTLQEFCAELEYFERPGAAQLISGLVERAALAPVRTTQPEAGGTVPLKEQETPTPPTDGPAQSRPHLRLVVGAAVTAGCFCAAWLGGSAVDYNRLGVVLTSLASGTTSNASETASGRPDPASPVGTRGGTSPQSRLSAEKSPARSKVATSNVQVAEHTSSRAVRASTGKTAPVASLALLPLNPVRPALISPGYRPVFGETVEIRATEAEPEAVGATGVRIYSNVDSGVVPPRSVYPKLPSDSFSEEPDTRTVLELVIGTNGLVEAAKLKSIPRDIHEFMLVSAAKAWIFEPATSEGLPVRYRHRVRISLP